MGVNKEKYTTVHIPTVLARMVDEIIDNEGCAYSSRSEFIKDAVRRFLEYYGCYPPNRKAKANGLSAGLSQEDILKLMTQTLRDSAK